MKRILIIEDDEKTGLWFKNYIEENIKNVVAEHCQTKESAKKIIKQAGLSVVLTDMRLPNDENDGYELIRFTKTFSPKTQIIAITAKPDYEFGLKCIRVGCSGYIDKLNFEKIIESVKSLVEYSNSNIDQDSIIERLILTGFIELKLQNTSKKKGDALESLCFNLFSTIPGFNKIEINKKSRSEEFDLVIRNESKDEFWKRFELLILAECKFMSKKKPGKNDFASFFRKIKNRPHSRIALGFFISINDFTSTFFIELDKEYKENEVVVPMNSNHIWDMICSEDRNEFLKELIQNTFLR